MRFFRTQACIFEILAKYPMASLGSAKSLARFLRQQPIHKCADRGQLSPIAICEFLFMQVAWRSISPGGNFEDRCHSTIPNGDEKKECTVQAEEVLKLKRDQIVVRSEVGWLVKIV